MIYPKEACGAFCRYCVLFCKNKKFNLISKTLVKYKNILSDLSAHIISLKFSASSNLQDAENFNKSIHHLSSLQVVNELIGLISWIDFNH